MNIVAVRHGQTSGNVNKIVESRAGGTLTKKGVAQAKAVAQELKGKKFDAIFSSSKQRCIDTANIILHEVSNSHLEVRDDLCELDKGIYDGGSWSNLPNYIDTDEYIVNRLEGGESWKDVEFRVSAFLNETYNKGYEQILIVSHDGVLRVLHSLLDKVPLKDAIKKYHENAKAYEWKMEDTI